MKIQKVYQCFQSLNTFSLWFLEHKHTKSCWLCWNTFKVRSSEVYQNRVKQQLGCGSHRCVNQINNTYMWDYQILFDIHQLLNSSRPAQRGNYCKMVTRLSHFKVKVGTLATCCGKVIIPDGERLCKNKKWKENSPILLLTLLNKTTKPGKDIPVSIYHITITIYYWYIAKPYFIINSTTCTLDSRWCTYLLYSDSMYEKLQLSHLFEWGQSDKVGKADNHSSGKNTKVRAQQGLNLAQPLLEHNLDNLHHSAAMANCACTHTVHTLKDKHCNSLLGNCFNPRWNTCSDDNFT